MKHARSCNEPVIQGTYSTRSIDEHTFGLTSVALGPSLNAPILRGCLQRRSKSGRSGYQSFLKKTKDFRDAVLARSGKSELSPLRRKLLLGPVVELLFATQETKRLAERHKKALQEELRLVEHTRLEVVVERIGDTSALLKLIHPILRACSLKSSELVTSKSLFDFFTDLEVPSLIRSAKEVLLLSPDLVEHFNLAWKGLKPAKVKQTVQEERPRLNVSDIDGVECDDEGDEAACEEAGRRIARSKR